MNYRVDKFVNQWFNKKLGYGTMAVYKKKNAHYKRKTNTHGNTLAPCANKRKPIAYTSPTVEIRTH